MKLRHLNLADTERSVVSTRSAAWFGRGTGLTVLPLSETRYPAHGHGALGTWHVLNPHRHFGGEEILWWKACFPSNMAAPQGSWIRSPHLSQHQPFSREGCLILVKTGHLLS